MEVTGMGNVRIRFLLKGCPVCSGDMFFDRLANELKCLQCGRPLNTLTDEEREALRKEASRRSKKARLPA